MTKRTDAGSPRASGVLPIWLSGLMLTGDAVLGAIVVELVARRLLPREIRAEHNAVAAAMFAIVGTTYAVLIAFAAMLVWEVAWECCGAFGRIAQA
jgi:hypothetical protein